MIVCDNCGASKDKLRLPRGWKRHKGKVWCNVCWKQSYSLRAVTMPIVSPIDVEWKDLDEQLHAAWKMTTAAANWMMTELYARDGKAREARRSGAEKLPPMERVYLYPEARKLFPGLAPQTVVSLAQTTERKYRAMRYDVIWTGRRSIPNHRYPTPLPIHNQSWKVDIEQERPRLDFRVGDHWMAAYLKGGPRFRRQRRAFEQMVSGEAARGELALYRAGSKTMAKLVAWLPKPEARLQRTGTLYVRTDPKSLLVVANEKDVAVWLHHADHIPRWVAEHQNRLQRWADDSKAEQRPIPSFSKRRSRAAKKFHQRMSSACHEAAAQLVGYARRRRFARIEFKEDTHEFCEQFVWYRLRELIGEKAEFHGIEFVASGQAAQDKPEALAEGENSEGSNL